MAPARMSHAPRQSTSATQPAVIMLTTGESSDFTCLALSADCTVAQLTSCRRFSSSVCVPNAFTTRSDSRPCSATVTISLWFLRTSLVAFLIAFLNAKDEEQQKRHDRDRHQREVDVQPEHQPEHSHNREKVYQHPRVPEDAKLWMVAISVVKVLKMMPI